MNEYTTSSIQLRFEFPTVKLCECGCGFPAPIAKQTDAKRGHVRGEPERFILGHRNKRSVADRFWGRVDKSNGPDACWLWMGCTSSFGYGRMKIDGRDMHTNRVSWELHNGEIPAGMKVLHRCDNPPCVNPAHLFLGTSADNTHDMIAKGRSRAAGVVGESNHNSKLTEGDVVEIRRCYNAGEKRANLARRFDVNLALICRIVAREIWRHVSD